MPGCECVSGRGRAAARRAGARAGGGRAPGSPGTRAWRALGGSRHLPVTGAGAPGPSPSDTTLRAAGTAAPTTRLQGEPGGGGEDASGYPRKASSSCTFPSSGSAACPPPPAAAAAARSFSASSSRRRRWCRRCRSTNYIRATRPGRLRETSAVSATPLHSHPRPSSPPRTAPERRIRQTSASSGPPLPLRGLGSPPRDPSSPFRLPLFLAGEPGHYCSSLGLVALRDLLERLGPGPPGCAGWEPPSGGGPWGARDAIAD